MSSRLSRILLDVRGLLIISMLFSRISFAQPQIGLESDADPLLADLLQELEQVTAIATHTRLNVDYVPGMVTVLHGKDLTKRGIHSFSEALQTVPGIEVTVSNEGQNQYVMRGIGKSFSSGKIKLLVDGRAMNAALSAASTVGLIPVQMIERIEIIRGPGSAIYGEYAYAGVINVIMRKDSQVFYYGTHVNKHSVGVTSSNYTTSSALKYVLNLSAFDYDGDDVTTGPDYWKSLGRSFSNTPGTSNEVERNATVNLRLEYSDFLWDSSVHYQNVGDYFGFTNALPPKVEPIRTVATAASDLDRKFELSNGLSGLVSAGVRAYALRSGLHYFQPNDFQQPGDPNVFEDGVRGSPNYTEYEGRGTIEINYSAIDRHDMLFGVHGAYIRQGNTWAERNHKVLVNGAIQEIPLASFQGSENWLTEGNSRMTGSVYAQDQWNVLKRLTITAGGRVDHYFDIGTSINPRLAGVYHFQDHHILKLQYSKAFRPPTFIEMFAQNNSIAQGNVDIKPETIQSVEAGYIYNNSRTVVRTTAFYTVMDELITNDDTTGQYENLESVKTAGAEVEFSQKITGDLDVSANATYLQVADVVSNENLPNIANRYAYANMSYSPMRNVNLNLSGQYIGGRNRESGDSRKAMAGYQVLNATVRVQQVFVNKLTIFAGIKNLLDETVLHPSPLVSLGAMTVPAYVNDYPRLGREFWLNFSYEM